MAVGGIVLVNEDKVELFLDEVGTCHLDGDGIAQAVDTSQATAADAVVLLVKLVEIVVQSADTHQTLAMRLVELHIQAPLGHARDVSREHASQTLAHEFNLLVLDGGTFGVGGELLLCAHVLALVFKLDGVNALAARGIHVQQAVYRQVGVAADGRGEVGVVVKGEAIVADVGRTVDGLGHRADGEDGEHLFLGLALGLFQHLVD